MCNFYKQEDTSRSLLPLPLLIAFWSGKFFEIFPITDLSEFFIKTSCIRSENVLISVFLSLENTTTTSLSFQQNARTISQSKGA